MAEIGTIGNPTLQKQNSSAILPTDERNRLEKIEREMIPLLNSIRERLGKPPVIVPKKKRST